VDLEQPRFPGIDPLVVRKGDRVRIRIGNLTMTNHPIHIHGTSSR
jgi:FtsP/CotA-like multicopper oxidase with cupredoxin domain